MSQQLAVLRALCAWRERQASEALAKERGLSPLGVLLPLPPLTREMSAAGVAGSNYLVPEDTSPGGIFVERVEGNYFNVIGLPLPMLYQMLIAAGEVVL